MKTIKPLFFFLLVSFLFISCEEDSPADELNESDAITSGLYLKDPNSSPTTAYLKITSTRGYLCRAQDDIEFSGNIVGNTINFEVDGSIIQTELRHEGNNLWARNLINNVYDEWTAYFPSNDTYPCNTNGGNSTDYGFINFTLTGNREITQFNQCNGGAVSGIANDGVTSAVYIEARGVEPSGSVSFSSDWYLVNGLSGTFTPYTAIRTTIVSSSGQVTQTVYLSTSGTGYWVNDTYKITATVRELVHNGGSSYSLTGNSYSVSADLKYANPCN